MSADLLAWLALGTVIALVAARLGYLAGRERAEAAASATIADLRIAIRHLQSNDRGAQ